MLRHANSFKATDELGRRYVLHVYIDWLDLPGGEEIAGTKAIRTADGLHVNRIEKGKYVIVETAVPLTSDDPAAE